MHHESGPDFYRALQDGVALGVSDLGFCPCSFSLPCKDNAMCPTCFPSSFEKMAGGCGINSKASTPNEKGTCAQ